MTQDLCYLSASEIQKGLRERRFSAVELSEAVLKRIDRLNPTLGAFQTLLATDSILAARHSDLRHADGSPSGPLDGVPICLSDLARVRDTACTWGSPLAVDAVERTDGAQVGRLREEGVTLVGKTRVAEFALGSVSEGALAGPVRNPWNLDHHVAGPSGGAGAAVAAGLATLALDFDHYGAVRLAAGSSGVFGFTAGRRRVPHVVAHGRNYSDMALMRTGIISRSVEDAATLLQIIAQPDVRDTFADQTLPAHFAERLH
ncbi:MAG: amidase, partial [Chlamydiia bacterium]|nr:amidase [Chlamydiia bacterium]